jgi:hypothetical protein
MYLSMQVTLLYMAAQQVACISSNAQETMHSIQQHTGACVSISISIGIIRHEQAGPQAAMP